MQLFMAAAAEQAEKDINYNKKFKDSNFKIKNTLDAISHSTCSMAIDVKAGAIIVNSMSGRTARMVSRFRCPVTILGMTTDEGGMEKVKS